MSDAAEVRSVREELQRALQPRYKVEKKLGLGGAGIAYMIRATASPVIRVAKVMRPAARRIPQLKREFLNEARKLSLLHHPNLVTAFEQSQSTDDPPYFVMDFVRGRHLDKAIVTLVRKSERGDWVYAVRSIFAQLADVLAYLHSQKPHALLHLDIKPANIILTYNHRRKPIPVLLDLGVSRFEALPSGSSKKTAAIGTFEMWPAKYIHAVKRLTNHGRTLFWIERQLINTDLDLHLLGKTLQKVITAALGASVDSTDWRASAKADLGFLQDTASSLDIDRGSPARFTTAIELCEALQRLDLQASRTRSHFDLGWVRLPGRTVLNFGREARRLTDWSKFQRLRGIQQLGFVSLVFPGATHSRFEHSLRVFENSLAMLDQITGPSGDYRFRSSVPDEDLVATALVALFHDVGHYPFAHQFRVRGTIPVHEERTLDVLNSDDAMRLITNTFSKDVYRQAVRLMENVYCLLNPSTVEDRPEFPAHFGVLRSVISSTIDADKLDYVSRDALHAGVPYGAVVDRERFLASLKIWWDKDDQPILLVSEKGRVCAEALVFARYLMTSEVYWNHAVRAYAAMLSAAMAEFDRAEIGPHLWDTDMGLLLWLSKDRRTAWLQELIDRRRPYIRTFVHQKLGGDEGARERDTKLFDILESAAKGQSKYADSVRESVRRALKIKTARDHEIVLDVPQGVTAVEGIQVLPEGHEEPGTVGPIFEAIGKNFDGFARKARIFVHPRLAASGNVFASTRLIRRALLADFGLR